MTYKITFKLKSPVCFQGFIMFDSILAYAYAQEQLKGVERQTERLTIDNLIDFTPMPIKMHERGYFMASWMLSDYADTVEYTGSWKKRWANEYDHLADFRKKKRKVRINAGPQKSYDMPMRLVDIPECYFYFQSEDPAEVERLIGKHIIGIGKKRKYGHGYIKSFKIEPVDYDPFEQIIRPIPVDPDNLEFVPGMEVTNVAWYPPYWMPENHALCRVK